MHVSIEANYILEGVFGQFMHVVLDSMNSTIVA